MAVTGGAPHGALWYLAIYAGISGTQIVFQFSSTLLLKILSLAAARTMHNNMLKSLLRSVSNRNLILIDSCAHLPIFMTIESHKQESVASRMPGPWLRHLHHCLVNVSKTGETG